MRTKLFFILAFISVSLAPLAVSGQKSFSDSLIAMLKSNDLLTSFKTKFEKINAPKDNLLNRQILDEYFEISFGMRKVPGYKIHIIANGERIIYGELVEGRKKIWHEADSVALKHFYKTYSNFFGSKVKVSEFFIDTVQYGRKCGFAAQDPPLRKKMDELIKTKNEKELTQWLQSALTEKQLYGVEGLKEMEKSGFKINKRQKKLIDFITHKKGEAKTCGVTFGSAPISEIFKKPE